MENKVVIGASLLMDLKGSSGLDHQQTVTYFTKVLPIFSEVLKEFDDEILDQNTWGDGILVVALDPICIARIALTFADVFRRTNLRSLGFPESVGCRISIHSGTMFVGHDSIRGRNGVCGHSLTLCSRIEPIVPVGQVYCSEDFALTVKAHLAEERMELVEIGTVALPKNFGPKNLFQLKWID